MKGCQTAWSATGFAQPREIGLHLSVGTKGCECGVEDSKCSVIAGTLDPVVHPLSFTTGGDNAGTAKVGEVARDLRLALLEDLHEVADADLAAVHQVEKAQPGAVSKCSEERGEIESGRSGHETIIYALTDMCCENTFVLTYMRRMHSWIRFPR